MHGGMITGVVLFGIVAHFVMRPNASSGSNLRPLVPFLLGFALVSCAVSVMLSRRVPRPSDADTATSFWVKAARLALISWALSEGAGLAAIVTYSQTGSVAAIVVAAVAVFILVLLNPGYFEGR